MCSIDNVEVCIDVSGALEVVNNGSCSHHSVGPGFFFVHFSVAFFSISKEYRFNLKNSKTKFRDYKEEKHLKSHYSKQTYHLPDSSLCIMYMYVYVFI